LWFVVRRWGHGGIEELRAWNDTAVDEAAFGLGDTVLPMKTFEFFGSLGVEVEVEVVAESGSRGCGAGGIGKREAQADVMETEQVKGVVDGGGVVLDMGEIGESILESGGCAAGGGGEMEIGLVTVGVLNLREGETERGFFEPSAEDDGGRPVVGRGAGGIGDEGT
jgi:hypothetical protein